VGTDGQGFTRRRFLVVAGTAAATGACSSAGVSPVEVGNINAGSVAQLNVGSLNVVGSSPVCIGRDQGGIYAMTLTCTHAGCDMGQNGQVTPQGVFCGCHGSQFDSNGNVVVGPARRSLDHFAVTADSSGNLTIRSDQIVDASQRLTV
jgi:Rieske Fe-S protein